MRSRFTAAFAALALLGASRVAFAQGTGAPSSADAPRPPPARPESSAATRLDRPVRVKASHRVDVIAPGERVETIIDRMRATRPVSPPASAKPVDRPPPRAPDRAARESDRAGTSGDGQRGQGGSGPRPPPGNMGPSSDRPHR